MNKFLDKIFQHKIRVYVKNNKIIVDAPKGAINKHFLRELKKNNIIEYIAMRPEVKKMYEDAKNFMRIIYINI